MLKRFATIGHVRLVDRATGTAASHMQGGDLTYAALGTIELQPARYVKLRFGQGR